MLDEERKKYKIKLTSEEISKMSKYRFKVLVNKKVNYFAFNYLKEKASGHDKSLKIFNEIKNNSVMKRAGYLKENMFSKSDCQLLFMLRSMMLDVKSNFQTSIKMISPAGPAVMKESWKMSNIFYSVKC